MDPIVTELIEDHVRRAEVARPKYGVGLDRTDLSTFEWVTHFREELMDAALYALRIEKELRSIQAIVLKFQSGVAIAKQRYRGRDLEMELARLAEETHKGLSPLISFIFPYVDNG